MKIRPERPDDAPAIDSLVEAAFGQPEEAALAGALRKADASAVSFVAELNGELLGHVLMSPMAAPEGALGLAPVSVAPAHQRKGVGTSLITAALDAARAGGWRAVFVLGDPGYYTRFGFSTGAAGGYDSPWAGPYFMAIELVPGALGAGGTAAYHPAFDEL